MLSPASRMPTLFIPHGGGPCFFMDPPQEDPRRWDSMAAYLRGLVTRLPERPKALLLISAHWEAPRPTLNVAANPELLFDYYGFPEHTYRLAYPAPGAPDLADRAAGLLASAGIQVDREAARGWDHGVFIPMLLAAPGADLPILQISLCDSLDPAEHLALGRALAPLRDDGVLMIGSGLSYHNLRQFGSRGADEASEAFDAWLALAVADPARREDELERWALAPFARFVHPREEHLLPLMVVAGAAAGEPGLRDYSDHVMGKAVSGFRFG